MNAQLLVPLLVTTVTAAISWIVAHRFTSARDLANKRRELRTKYLLDAYRLITNALGRPATQENLASIEIAISDLQLLGNQDQVARAAEYAKMIGGKDLQDIDVGELIVELRNSLRDDLGLLPVTTTLQIVRLHPANEASPNE